MKCPPGALANVSYYHILQSPLLGERNSLHIWIMSVSNCVWCLIWNSNPLQLFSQLLHVSCVWCPGPGNALCAGLQGWLGGHHVSWHRCSGGWPSGQYRSFSCPPTPRIRGYLCSFPMTCTPYLGEEIYPLSRVLVTIGFFSSKNTLFPQDKCFNSTPFPGKVVIRMRPLMCSIGERAGFSWPYTHWGNIKKE